MQRKRGGAPVYLVESERRALMGVIKVPRDRAIFRLAMEHGLRASELGLIGLEDWNRHTNRIYLRRLKGSISQDYLLTSEELRAIRAWVKVRGRESGPMFPGYKHAGIRRHQLNGLMHRYGEKAGLPAHKRHFHCLKHTCGTMLRDAGVEIANIQDHLGHSDIRSTMIYAKGTEKQRMDVARRIEAAR